MAYYGDYGAAAAPYAGGYAYPAAPAPYTMPPAMGYGAAPGGTDELRWVARTAPAGRG